MRTLALASLACAFWAAPASAQCTLYGSPGGSGCGFSTPWGIPTIRCSGAPTVGNQSYAIEANIPCQTTAPMLMLGSCLAPPYRIGGPFGAGGFCGPTEASCLLFIGPRIYAGVPGVSTAPPSGFRFALPIPADPALRGGVVCAQLFTLCATMGGTCLGASHGLFVQVQ
jgi:hypothetical protein